MTLSILACDETFHNISSYDCFRFHFNVFLHHNRHFYHLFLLLLCWNGFDRHSSVIIDSDWDRFHTMEFSCKFFSSNFFIENVKCVFKIVRYTFDFDCYRKEKYVEEKLKTLMIFSCSFNEVLIGLSGITRAWKPW